MNDQDQKDFEEILTTVTDDSLREFLLALRTLTLRGHPGVGSELHALLCGWRLRTLTPQRWVCAWCGAQLPVPLEERRMHVRDCDAHPAVQRARAAEAALKEKS